MFYQVLLFLMRRVQRFIFLDGFTSSTRMTRLTQWTAACRSDCSAAVLQTQATLTHIPFSGSTAMIINTGSWVSWSWVSFMKSKWDRGRMIIRVPNSIYSAIREEFWGHLYCHHPTSCVHNPCCSLRLSTGRSVGTNTTVSLINTKMNINDHNDDIGHWTDYKIMFMMRWERDQLFWSLPLISRIIVHV